MKNWVTWHNFGLETVNMSSMRTEMLSPILSLMWANPSLLHPATVSIILFSYRSGLLQDDTTTITVVPVLMQMEMKMRTGSFVVDIYRLALHISV